MLILCTFLSPYIFTSSVPPNMDDYCNFVRQIFNHNTSSHCFIGQYFSVKSHFRIPEPILNFKKKDKLLSPIFGVLYNIKFEWLNPEIKRGCNVISVSICMISEADEQFK